MGAALVILIIIVVVSFVFFIDNVVKQLKGRRRPQQVPISIISNSTPNHTPNSTPNHGYIHYNYNTGTITRRNRSGNIMIEPVQTKFRPLN